MQYVDRMDLAYAAADLVVCRAGAITCSELMATGTPAVLVPSPNVAEDHQTRNARSVVDRGGAVLLTDQRVERDLGKEVRALLNDAGRCSDMSAALRATARPEAADTVADHILKLCRS